MRLWSLRHTGGVDPKIFSIFISLMVIGNICGLAERSKCACNAVPNCNLLVFEVVNK